MADPVSARALQRSPRIEIFHGAKGWPKRDHGLRTGHGEDAEFALYRTHPGPRLVALALCTSSSTTMTSMGPPRSPVLAAASSSSSAKTAHSLAILSEYTHTLDSVPLDLSRNFADLRELDAVLSASMSTVTNKVIQLTSMIESKSASKEDRLWLLAEIADEVSRLKPGADDKIRVACHAADGLKGHKAHMTNLLQHMPEPEYGNTSGMLSRKTVYPHVATRSYVPAGMPGEGGRRQRRTALLSNSAAMEATPNKRKRVVGDDGDVTRSPAKPKTGDASRRNANRKKCVTHSLWACLMLIAKTLPETTVRRHRPNRCFPCSHISRKLSSLPRCPAKIQISVQPVLHRPRNDRGGKLMRSPTSTITGKSSTIPPLHLIRRFLPPTRPHTTSTALVMASTNGLPDN